MQSSSENWQRVEELFVQATKLTPDERPRFLEKACGQDPLLRREVESLLKFDDDSDTFMEMPTFALAAISLEDEQHVGLAGEQLGPYKVVQEIGRGGMGAVYLAERADDEYRKHVAVKLVKRGFDTEEMRRRFRHERQILARLDHENIARLLDGGTTEDGRPFLVMEQVKGVPITRYCDAQRLSTESRLRLFLAVCEGVSYAHRNLVIHRDIKPANVLVTEEGVPKLLDFGIAKLLDPEETEQEGHTVTQLGVMTPEYASPEQVKGLSVTTATDVYSLGVLLYELLTGHRPYRLASRSPEEVARVICEQEPTRPSAAVATTETIVSSGGRGRSITPEDIGSARDLSPEKLRRRLAGDLDIIILTAIRKEPERRYASVVQLSEDIRRHLTGLPILARKDTFGYRGSKFVRRHRMGVAVATLMLVGLAIGVVAVGWQARVAARERDIARREKIKAERINAFLQEMLGLANPAWYSRNRDKGRESTISEVLDETADRVESELADQPEVRAELQRNIGSSYLYQSRFDVAERHLRAALDTQLKLYGEDHSETARTLLHLGEVSYLKGDPANAEPYLQRALAAYRKIRSEGGGETRWLAAAYSDLANVLKMKGDDQRWESLFREGLKLAPELVGDERAVIPVIRTNLGAGLAERGEFDEAENLLRTSIEELRGLSGGERHEIGVSFTFLGDVLTNKQKLQEAHSVLREGEEVYRRSLGEKNVYLVLNLSSQSYVLYLKGDYANAEKKANEALQMVRLIYPTPNRFYTGPLSTLGQIMNKTGRSRAAEELLRESLRIRSADSPKGFFTIALSAGALGECLTTQGRYEEAEPLLRESYESLKASQKDGSTRINLALSRLINLYEAWGKRDLVQQYERLARS